MTQTTSHTSPTSAHRADVSQFRPAYQQQFHHKSSAYSGFYNLTRQQRLEIIANHSQLHPDDLANLRPSPGQLEIIANQAIENAISTMNIPMGIATNLKIEQTDILVPMCTEEPSVIAAVSHGAKLARAGGGFATRSAAGAITTGQIQLKWHHPEPHQATTIAAILNTAKPELMAKAQQLLPSMTQRGGGIRDIHWRWISPINSVVIHVEVDTVDAMGANTINTLCETLATDIQALVPDATLGLRILTNLAIGRLTRASCKIPVDCFGPAGLAVAQAIEAASHFSRHDIYRACTHNKGIMNGISAVALATANDTRAIEAAAHTYAAHNHGYQPLSTWQISSASSSHHHKIPMLCGQLELPIPTGVIGGMTRFHPTAQSALKILGSPNAKELAEIMAAVGLAGNLAALKALATEGIQAGHMKLHHKKPHPTSSSSSSSSSPSSSLSLSLAQSPVTHPALLASVTYFVPAKVMLAGEYAVLFGYQAIAATLSQGLTVTCNTIKSTQTQFPLITIHSDLWDHEVTLSFNQLDSSQPHSHQEIITHTLRLFVAYLKSHYPIPWIPLRSSWQPPTSLSYQLNIKSQIPSWAGIGSSSAVILGTLLAFNASCYTILNHAEIIHVACAAQRAYQSGYSSGYDVVSQYYGGIVLTAAPQPLKTAALIQWWSSPPAITQANTMLSLYIQTQITSATSTLLTQILAKHNRDSDAKQPPAALLDICSSQQHLVEQLIQAQLTPKLISSVQSARSCLFAHSGFDYPKELFAELNTLPQFDRSYTIKTTGAGGYDALLGIGPLDEDAKASLTRHGYQLFTTSFSAQGAKRLTPPAKYTPSGYLK